MEGGQEAGQAFHKRVGSIVVPLMRDHKKSPQNGKGLSINNYSLLEL